MGDRHPETVHRAGHAGGCCACGGVRFIAHGPLEAVGVCHCLTCRRWSGYVWGAVRHARDDIEWLADETLSWWRSPARACRGFCQVCGASLFFDADHDAGLEIRAGAFDGPLGRATARHIFCAEAGAY
ncbi:GFA family protein [Salinisphaera sp. Q1T1-3]|uniref:GFA family protein n=1 Tax=Salinisphaera sp. Q1T1-3 TaxID=2321229 RepID=UPI000E717307|nr:GFA family protein [Salinisphaera sp. Q1T1-3]RJS91617.1 GFA family protein [Salinisphaera sp. Q1T1-3]